MYVIKVEMQPDCLFVTTAVLKSATRIAVNLRFSKFQVDNGFVHIVNNFYEIY
jgi:hypothetical protein